MGINYYKLSIKPETKKLFDKVVISYKDEHPEYIDFILTEDFIVKKMCEYILYK